MFIEGIMFKRPPKVPYVSEDILINPTLEKIKPGAEFSTEDYLKFTACFSKRNGQMDYRRLAFSLEKQPKLKFPYILIGKFKLDGQLVYALFEKK